ncbi:transmembrane protein 69-like isoform X1 [Osmerus mordax]|uniref:transmembrane protein 69-like isoform X1 n=2 Tax=Osmerus mordax TaxID=8014 RepID=UPI0035109592
MGLKMMSLVLRRHLSGGGPGWRALNHDVKVPNCLAKRHVIYTSSHTTCFTSVVSWSASTRLGSHRPLSCSTSYLCQGRPEGPEKVEGQNGFSLKALVTAPKPALYLGFSGLAPFLAAPLLMAVTQSYYPEVAFAQVVYGASIVSFLGGVRWGFALPEGSPAQPDWMNLGNSVVPSLLAWVALLCRDNITEGALIVVMGLGLSLHYDLTLLPGYPGWFKAMRTILTLVATFSLVATLTLKKFCPEKKIKALEN